MPKATGESPGLAGECSLPCCLRSGGVPGDAVVMGNATGTPLHGSGKRGTSSGRLNPPELRPGPS